MKKQVISTLIFCMLAIQAMANIQSYTIRSYQDNIQSVQLQVNSNALAENIIYLNSKDYIDFYFDEMSHNGHSYSYQVVHCDANWSESDLASNEFIRGFASDYIDDYETSINTTFLYTNYHFRLPNENTDLLVSGNYAVKVFEDNDSETPICTFAFSVLDPKVEIEGTIRTQTDIEINGAYQQVDFDILSQNFNIQNPKTELKVQVKQNNRTDNIVRNIQPTFFANGKLSYKNNCNLIFEGGNEYHRFDISSRYNHDARIEKIEFLQEHFNVFLVPNTTQENVSWQSEKDVNGKRIINFEGDYDGRTEADYYYVHFSLHPNSLLPNGNIFIGGEWNENRLDNRSKMNYDSKRSIFYKTLLLKQGGYNYQYWLVPDGSNKASTKETEGSHWQTENEYAIFVYYRPFGERYDQLIGMKILK